MSRDRRPTAGAGAPRSIVECERYLGTHYPRQRSMLTTPEAVRAAYAVARGRASPRHPLEPQFAGFRLSRTGQFAPEIPA
ncbi:hypothetical protein CLBKND_02344 [Methylorubrum aminovorans]